MYYKTIISSVVLLTFLSCSPDQEVLQNESLSKEDAPYRILDMDDFSEEERKIIEDAIKIYTTELNEQGSVDI